MNVKRLKKLIRELEREDRDFAFDMSIWIDKKLGGCGTTCCIGGLAQMLFLRIPEFRAVEEADDPQLTMAALGLTLEQGRALFYGEIDGYVPGAYNIRPLNRATPQDAVKAIRNLMQDPEGDPWRHLRS